MNNVFYNTQYSEDHFCTIDRNEYWREKEQAIESAKEWMEIFKDSKRKYFRVVKINLENSCYDTDINIIWESKIEK